MSSEEELKQKIEAKESEIEMVQKEFELKEKELKKALPKESEGIIENMRLELKTAQKKLLSMARQLKDYQDHNEIPNVTQLKPEVEKMLESVKKLMDAISAVSKEKERFLTAKLKGIIQEKSTKIKEIRSEIKNLYKKLMYSEDQKKESNPPEKQP